MTAIHGMEDRNLIPRWRQFGDAVRSQELDSLGADSPPMPEELRKKRRANFQEAVRAFASSKGLHSASDLLTQAMLGHHQHEEAATAAALWILERPAPESLRSLAELVIGRSAEGTKEDRPLPEVLDRRMVVSRATRLRRIVKREPHNAVRWTDLALAQVTLGSLPAAERSMRTALNLQPANRFVVRSAVRLYLLLDQFDLAHHVVSHDPSLVRDPWLRATSLATASLSGQSPTSMRATRRVLEVGHYSPWHLSELAGQVATLELGAGDMRRARRTMRQALVDPTENSLAQAEWASAQHGIDAPSSDKLTRPLSFEARALANAAAANWEESIHAAIGWHADQAFDPSPAIFLSYIASITKENYALSEEAARRGLISNPSHGLLRNNLVFALANQGKTSEAREQLLRVPQPRPGTREGFTLMATKGLVRFREGDPEGGRALYSTAVERLLSVPENRDVGTLAQIFWAREELRAGTPNAPALVSTALSLAGNSQSGEVKLWTLRLLDIAESLVRDQAVHLLRSPGGPQIAE